MYARVAARIRQDIAAGVWPIGSTLPGEVQLAARYEVARVTLVRALRVLRDEGLLVTERGVGSRVAAVPVIRTVRVGPDDQVLARLPDDDERERLRMPPGVPVLVVTRGARPGDDPELHDGSVTRISGQLRAPGQRP